MATLEFRTALRDAMTEEMERDDDIFLIGEEVAEYDGAYKVSKGMLDHFGSDRVIDSPISELGFAGLGIGAAMNGLRPIVEFMTFNFSFVAFDQVINNAPNMRYMSGGQFDIPIVFRGPNGAAGQLGATHSNSTEALYSNIPGLKVVSPSVPDDGKGLLKTAIRDDDPVVFLESELMYGMQREVSEESDYTIPIGSARVGREGDDVTIVAHSKSYHIAMDAAEALEEQGYEAEVIDPRTIKPLDIETIVESVVKTNRLVVIDESTPFTSVASEITHQVQDRAFDYLDAPILRVTAPDTPAPYAPNLMDEYMPGVDETVDKCLRVLYAE
ncbi:pyruvate dehydrogenase complex E1 component subunit beta [Salinibacter grassmerensis]|uniref:pyruvate dehydrogenase complex E1 component subunit beta n=1 Tax=Salinibacter grassmerensis TaxID=3040353 RepID=UPI0021E8542D|nr:pyruvate dehydrogenase complex E1 component subunit beta [Salinibacter grassmerensis]